jgi:hypothetical protein
MSLLTALQDALAVEYQAVYGYGVVGAHAGYFFGPGAPVHDRAQVEGRLDAHKAVRDQLAQLITAMHAQPVPAAAAYRLPFPVEKHDAAARLGRQLEQAAQRAAWTVIAASASASPARTLMVSALAGAAEWDARWAFDSGELLSVPALPGQPDASQPSTTPTSSPS